MGYTSEIDDLADLIEKIANELIATGGWSNGDVTWTTVDKTENNARRCLYQSDGLYMALEMINQTEGLYIGGSCWAKGLRVTFSTDWDVENHIYIAPYYQTFNQFVASYGPVYYDDLATLTMNSARWTSAAGFVLHGAPPESVTADMPGTFLITVTRITDKFYADGFTNFFCYSRCSRLQYDYVDDARHKSVIRPWIFQENNENRGFMNVFAAKRCISGLTLFVYPLFFNDLINVKPVAQSSLFLFYTAGLTDGDILAVSGATRKYICKSFSCKGSGFSTFALRYLE